MKSKRVGGFAIHPVWLYSLRDVCIHPPSGSHKEGRAAPTPPPPLATWPIGGPTAAWPDPPGVFPLKLRTGLAHARL